MLKRTRQPDDCMPGRCALPSSSTTGWPTHGRHAERGRLAQAKERLLELRTGLVGHSPGDGAGLLRDASSPLRNRAAAHHPIGLDRPLHRDISGQPAAADTGRGVSPTVGRSDWLEAIQLSAQAISDLTAISTVSNSPTRPEIRPEAMAAWEARHRDRIGRWARRTLAGSEAAIHGDIDRSNGKTAAEFDRLPAVSTGRALDAVRSMTPLPPGTSPELGLDVLSGSSRDEGPR